MEVKISIRVIRLAHAAARRRRRPASRGAMLGDVRRQNTAYAGKPPFPLATRRADYVDYRDLGSRRFFRILPPVAAS
jgi:hypothetical protein